MTNNHSSTPAGIKRVALIQMSMDPDTKVNLDKAAERVYDAVRQGATLVCLPELFRAQYFCQREDHALFGLAESIPGPSTDVLTRVCQETGVVLVASLFERRAPGLYHNTAVTIETDGRIADVYRKMHIPDDPLYYEKFYFTPGDLGFKATQTTQGPVGTLVCWDQWYPEGARLTALKGAEVLFFPTAIGWLPPKRRSLVTPSTKPGRQPSEPMPSPTESSSAPSTASATSTATSSSRSPLPTATPPPSSSTVPATTPHNPALQFWGGSFIADPFGRILAQASFDKEETLIADLDPKLIEITRQHWPFLRDRRIDAYEGIAKRFLD